jgi:hypothetical protein
LKGSIIDPESALTTRHHTKSSLKNHVVHLQFEFTSSG